MIIPLMFISPRLLFREVTRLEAADLQAVVDSVSDRPELSLFGWVPLNAALEAEFPRLPDPLCDPDRCQLKMLIHIERDECIGWLKFCNGFPDERSCYLDELFIVPEFRRQKFGTEAVERLHEVALDAEYERLVTQIDTRNTDLLRFFISCGIDRILGVSGGKSASAGSQAVLRLEKTSVPYWPWPVEPPNRRKNRKGRAHRIETMP